jgi:uncharacterized protein YqeY
MDAGSNPNSALECPKTEISESKTGDAMSIVQRMREQLPAAMKARDSVKLTFLRHWIAGLTLGSGEEMGDEAAIKKMRGVLKEAQTGLSTFTPEEIALLREWLPALLDRDGIRAALGPVADAIRSAPKDGIAMGAAMKALAGQAVDSDDVKAVVSELRS